MLRRNFLLAILAVFSVVLWGCGANGGSKETSGGGSSAGGKTMYTAVNIWYEKPLKIFPLFHAGAILPVGTRVTITDTDNRSIEFVADGIEYRIYTHKYYNTTGNKMLGKLFSDTNPKAKGGKYFKFSKTERENIDNGILATGMSRDAAIMAYGYPPTHANPNINANTWQLWKTRWNRLIVYFKKDKISRIKD